MNTDRKSFIEELRSLSDPVKRKVFWGAVAASMILVVYFWLAYFNTIVPGAVPGPDTTVQTSTTGTEGAGVFGLFADAAGSFWQAIENGARGMVSEMKNPKQYNIGPK
jgi:hypothetical protein